MLRIGEEWGRWGLNERERQEGIVNWGVQGTGRWGRWGLNERKSDRTKL